MTGRSVLNGFPDTVGNGWSYAFKNTFKLVSTITYPDPGAIKSDGLPANTASLPSAITWSSWILPVAYGTGSWVLKWTGTGSLRLDFDSQAPTVDSNTGTTTCSVAGNNLTVTGTDVRVVLHFAGGTPFNNGGRFNASQTFTNFSNLVFCKLADESTVDSEPFNPDLTALVQETGAKVLRLMVWSFINNSIVSQHAYRAPTNAFSYTALRWQTEAWAGTASLSGMAYTVSAPSTWPGLVDGATVQLTGSPITLLPVTGTVSGTGGVCRISITGDISGAVSENQWVFFGASSGAGGNASLYKAHIVSTGATSVVELIGSTYSSNETGYFSYATLQVGASAAKPIMGTFYIRPTAQGGNNAGQMTFVYNAVADAFFVSGGGMQTGIPVEMQVALCNEIGVDYWNNIPLLYTNSSISSHVSYIRDNLNPNLTAYFELSNELWNTGFGQFTLSYQLGKFLGFAQGNGRQLFGYQGLRSRQLFETVRTTFAASGRTNYKNVIAFQAFGASSNTRDYLLKGADLVSGATSPVTGTTTYDTFTSSFSGSAQSYNASPNRPADYANHLSYATYYQGAQCTWPTGAYANSMTSGGPVGNTVGLLGAADQYAVGDAANMALALDWLDWDFRQGTINGSAANPDQSLNGLLSIYTTWENVITTNFSDSDRALIGMPPLTCVVYEGGLQATYPTTATLSGLGFSSGDQTKYGGSGGRINTLLTAYKNDHRFAFLVKEQFDGYMAKAHAALPGWYNLQGPNEWSLLNGGTYSRETGTPAWASFDQFVRYNDGLRRFLIKT